MAVAVSFEPPATITFDASDGKLSESSLTLGFFGWFLSSLS